MRVLCPARLDARWYDVWFAIDVASNQIEVGVAEGESKATLLRQCVAVRRKRSTVDGVRYTTMTSRIY